MNNVSAIDVIVACGLMALLAMILIKVGLRPARRGEEPRCRKCDYLVANISSDRCPECGASLLGRGTVRGQRPKRRAAWISGLVILLMTLWWGGSKLYRIVNWYERAPAWWVMKDTKSTWIATSERAWGEMRRRQEKGKLSKYWEGKMADAILEGHGPYEYPGGGIPNSLIFLWRQHEAGKLTPAQAEGLYRWNTRVNWKVRPVVLVGQDVPYGGDVTCFLPGGWVAKFEPAGRDRGAYIGCGVSGTGWDHAPGGVLKGSAKDKPGEYEVELVSTVALYHGEDSEDVDEVVKKARETLKTRPVWEGKWVDRLKFRVVEKGSVEFLKAIDAPEQAAAVKASLKIEGCIFYAKEANVYLTVRAQQTTMNLAFDVIARVDGKEYWVADMEIAKGATWGSAKWSWPQGVRPKKVDLIFRGSEKVAAKSLDLFDYWKGEVVFEGVEIKEQKD